MRLDLLFSSLPSVQLSHTSPILDSYHQNQSLSSRNSVCKDFHVIKSHCRPGSLFGHHPHFFVLKDGRVNTFLLLRPFFSLPFQHFILILNIFYPLSSCPSATGHMQKHRRRLFPSSLLSEEFISWQHLQQVEWKLQILRRKR